MTDRRWKARERQAAALLGTVRLPSNGHAQPDMLATIGGQQISVEHKSRASLPQWLLDAMRQAARNAPEGAIPLVAISAGTGAGPPLERLAVLRLADLPMLLRAVGEQEAACTMNKECVGVAQ